jgi:hypothetical protein
MIPKRMSPKRLLLEHLERYDPDIAALTLALREMVLEEAPGAHELVHAGYAVAVAFTFTGKMGGAFCYVAAYRSHVNLGFNHGAALSDPDRLLLGSGRQMRHLRVAAPNDLSLPHIRRFIRAAVERAPAAGTRVS